MVRLLCAALVTVGCSNGLAPEGGLPTCADAGAFCRNGLSLVGQFQFSLSAQTNAQSCVDSAGDGGFASAGSFTASLCKDDADGGSLFLTTGSVTHESQLGANGHFSFALPSSTVTACGCSLSDTETISGNILRAPDGGAVVIGTMQDALTDAGSPCRCTLPCSLTYALSGTCN